MVRCCSSVKMEKLHSESPITHSYTGYKYEDRLQAFLRKELISACGNCHHSIDLIIELIFNVADQYGQFYCLVRSGLFI